MKLSSLPFLLTYIALPISWVVNFSGVGIIAWLPEILALFLFFFVISKGKCNPTFKTSNIIVALLFLLHFFYQAINGEGVGNSAVVSIVMMSVIFFVFFDYGYSHGDEKTIIKNIGIIYSIHILFILIEIILIQTETTNILSFFSGGKYKADVINNYTLVPQSLFNQSQAASQMCVFSITWYFLLYLSKKKLNINFNMVSVFTFVSSVAVLSFYYTTTSLFIFIMMMFLIIYLIPFAKKRLFRFLFLFIVFSFFNVIFQTLSYKINTDLYFHAEHYITAFTDPIYVFMMQPLSVQLWGSGGVGSLKALNLKHADFGLGVVVLQAGIVITSIALFWLLAIIGRMFLCVYKRKFSNDFNLLWLWLGTSNALISLGFLVSLIHYTVVLQMGGRTLFALHIALTIFSFYQLKKSQPVSNGNGVL